MHAAVTRATIRQCAVLAGGLGTRLGGLTAALPKPLLPCGDRPFLAWLLRDLARFGVEDVVLLTGHLSTHVEAAVADLIAAAPRAMRITVSAEPQPSGTGGALWHAREHLDERFLVANGDSLLDGNLSLLLAGAADQPGDVVGRLALHWLPDASRHGVVDRDGDRITAFRERGAPGAPGLINAGVYLFDRRVLNDLAPVCSLERDVLPRLAARWALAGSVIDGWFIDIGVPDDLARAQAELPRRLRRPALFLDRDGVINVDHGYVGSRERFEWTATARPAIRAATDAGWHVFVVTNQSGVARGRYHEADVQNLLAWMTDEVRAGGGTIDDTRYCPFHPEATIDAYRRDSDWRKPAPGMLRDLIHAWELDPAACVLIGDQPSDLAAAAAAGMAAHAFDGGDLYAVVRAVVSSPVGGGRGRDGC